VCLFVLIYVKGDAQAWLPAETADSDPTGLVLSQLLLLVVCPLKTPLQYYHHRHQCQLRNWGYRPALRHLEVSLEEAKKHVHELYVSLFSCIFFADSCIQRRREGAPPCQSRPTKIMRFVEIIISSIKTRNCSLLPRVVAQGNRFSFVC
jgi:hypothetical protein